MYLFCIHTIVSFPIWLFVGISLWWTFQFLSITWFIWARYFFLIDLLPICSSLHSYNTRFSTQIIQAFCQHSTGIFLSWLIDICSFQPSAFIVCPFHEKQILHGFCRTLYCLSLLTTWLFSYHISFCTTYMKHFSYLSKMWKMFPR